MFDQALLDRMFSEVARGNVDMRGDPDNYVIFKYNTDCHINDNWNGTNNKARGIIFYAPTARIVCRPFDKFFNLDERQGSRLEELPDGNFIVWEKLDGSCCSSFLMWNEIRCATPGSYESPQAVWATEWLQKHLLEIGKDKRDDFFEDNLQMTFIFEGLWPEDSGNPTPGVLNYGDREELVLLSVRRHSGLELHPREVDILADKYGFARPKRYESIEFSGITRELRDAIPDDEEGYVIQYPGNDNFRVKVKSPTYMMLHRTRDRISYKGICEIMEVGESRRWFTTLPKHMQKRADDILAVLNSRFYEIFYQVDDVYQEARVLGTRKEQALYIMDKLPKQYTGLCFAKLDDRYDDRQIWGVLKKEVKYEPADDEA